MGKKDGDPIVIVKEEDETSTAVKIAAGGAEPMVKILGDAKKPATVAGTEADEAALAVGAVLVPAEESTEKKEGEVTAKPVEEIAAAEGTPVEESVPEESVAETVVEPADATEPEAKPEPIVAVSTEEDVAAAKPTVTEIDDKPYIEEFLNALSASTTTNISEYVRETYFKDIKPNTILSTLVSPDFTKILAVHAVDRNKESGVASEGTLRGIINSEFNNVVYTQKKLPRAKKESRVDFKARKERVFNNDLKEFVENVINEAQKVEGISYPVSIEKINGYDDIIPTITSYCLSVKSAASSEAEHKTADKIVSLMTSVVYTMISSSDIGGKIAKSVSALDMEQLNQKVKSIGADELIKKTWICEHFNSSVLVENANDAIKTPISQNDMYIPRAFIDGKETLLFNENTTVPADINVETLENLGVVLNNIKNGDKSNNNLFALCQMMKNNFDDSNHIVNSYKTFLATMMLLKKDNSYDAEKQTEIVQSLGDIVYDLSTTGALKTDLSSIYQQVDEATDKMMEAVATKAENDKLFAQADLTGIAEERKEMAEWLRVALAQYYLVSDEDKKANMSETILKAVSVSDETKELFRDVLNAVNEVLVKNGKTQIDIKLTVVTETATKPGATADTTAKKPKRTAVAAKAPEELQRIFIKHVREEVIQKLIDQNNTAIENNKDKEDQKSRIDALNKTNESLTLLQNELNSFTGNIVAVLKKSKTLPNVKQGMLKLFKNETKFPVVLTYVAIVAKSISSDKAAVCGTKLTKDVPDRIRNLIGAEMDNPQNLKDNYISNENFTGEITTQLMITYNTLYNNDGTRKVIKKADTEITV